MEHKMESLAFAAITLTLSIVAAFLIPVIASLFRRRSSSRALPPGPTKFPIIGNLHWLHVSLRRIEPLLRRLRTLYSSPAVTLHIGSCPVVFISDRDLAHDALVHHGAAFAGRPGLMEANRLLSNNGHTVNNATYGPLWRLLRRNLTSEIMHPSRIRLFSQGRDWVLGVLLEKLRSETKEKGVVIVKDTFQYAMFCLLVLMCFGERPGEEGIRKIEKVQRDLLLFFSNLQVFAFFPGFARYVFPKRWETMMEMRQSQTDVYLPLIQARRERRMKAKMESNDKADTTTTIDSFVYSYVDSLLDLELSHENNRKLTDQEIIGLCSEFLNAGTDTTSTALQWIMANLVKYPEVQAKLFDEINSSITAGSRVSEEDLPKMPYLKAVVLEGLRRHPPGHFVLPHSTTQEVQVGGYVFPRGVSVNVTVAEIGWDKAVWKDPMEFRPERFLPGGEGEGVDITGSREIKMMPFGVGRRICPGLNLALLHLEYFVANLVAEFEWQAVDGEDIDLEEKPEFTIVMKYPLRARLVERRPITT